MISWDPYYIHVSHGSTPIHPTKISPPVLHQPAWTPAWQRCHRVNAGGFLYLFLGERSKPWVYKLTSLGGGFHLAILEDARHWQFCLVSSDRINVPFKHFRSSIFQHSVAKSCDVPTSRAKRIVWQCQQWQMRNLCTETFTIGFQQEIDTTWRTLQQNIQKLVHVVSIGFSGKKQHGFQHFFLSPAKTSMHWTMRATPPTNRQRHGPLPYHISISTCWSKWGMMEWSTPIQKKSYHHRLP